MKEEFSLGPLDLGPCCGCGRESVTVRNLLMLHRPAPIPGTGWGCHVCDLPPNGAMAIMCDACMAAKTPPLRAIKGLAMGKRRIAIGDLLDEPFDHNQAIHEAKELEEALNTAMLGPSRN